ncbi:hypothetical protein [Mucilaginibacter sp. FT3.2]|uniref:hypothetical protein n=1 Tax=Mucilaginibacter sp. FT3.2 TaxID=2723090 RepID=UPI00161F09EE|nr:hypothetical protein [Mucilaginibacter sp. FT3.2]MBB6232046.1 hypothetical protein [Mucilaginibacter sp. FT3.2]
MLTELGPNKTDLYGRIFLQIVLIAFVAYFIYVIVHPTGHHHYAKQLFKDKLWCGCALIANVVLFLKLYFTPYWVSIDDELKTLTVRYLIQPTRTIGLHDIAGYGTTAFKSKSVSYFGISIHLHQGKSIPLSDLNLGNYFPVELFLIDAKVKKLGQE